MARSAGVEPATFSVRSQKKRVYDCIWLFKEVSYNILRPGGSLPSARWVVGDEWVYINNRRVRIEDRCHLQERKGFTLEEEQKRLGIKERYIWRKRKPSAYKPRRTPTRWSRRL